SVRGHRRPIVRHSNNRDAFLHGAEQDAQVAADAVVLANDGLRPRPTRAHPCPVAGPHRRDASWVDDSAVDGEVDALVRALVASDVAEVALDALLRIDAGHRLEREVEVAEVRDARNRRPDHLVYRLGALLVEPVREAVG